MKKYIQLICFACIAALVSGCSVNGSKTTSNISNGKKDQQIVPSGDLQGSTEEEEITGGAPEKPTAQPEEREIKSAAGYVLEQIGTIVYVDIENPGGRTYPHEGDDRGVAFDITNATITQEPDAIDGTLSSNPIRKGVTVDILYYVEGNANIVTTIHSDNEEKEPINYVSIGFVNRVEDNKVTLNITEGDQSGTIAVFDFSSSMDSIYGIAVNDRINITYYVEDGNNMVMSYFKPES